MLTTVRFAASPVAKQTQIPEDDDTVKCSGEHDPSGTCASRKVNSSLIDKALAIGF